jgi:hypothetical protein
LAAGRLMMKRSLSSDLTAFFKFFPAFWIPFFGLGVLAAFLGGLQGKNGEPPSLSFDLLMLALWIGGSIFSYLTCASLKKMSVDERYLYVSNYFREISIPLSDVADVAENSWLNFHPVTVKLKRSSVFGNKITFMPERGMLYFGGSHPVVAQLKKLAMIDEA